MDKSTILRRLAELQKVEALRAVPPGITAPEADAEYLQRSLQGASAETQSDLALFHGAGWTFSAPDQAPVENALEVVVDKVGHLKLSGQTLTVKISPDFDRAAVEAWVQQKGLHLRRNLGFAPNTFLLEVTKGSALNVAQSLNSLPEVLYAEPNFIEPIQSR